MNPRGHVLLWTDDPGAGGVAQYNHALLCGLARRGHRLTCVQSRADNPLTRAQAELGVRHDWLDYHTGDDFQRTLTDRAGTRDVFLRHRPDLVVFSNGSPLSNFAAKDTACGLALPCLIVEGFAAEPLAGRFLDLLGGLSRHYAHARDVIAVSGQTLALLRSHFGLAPASGRVIRYGRPAEFFRPPEPEIRRRLRAEAGADDGDLLCFTAARLEPIKGYDCQLLALARLRGTAAWPGLRFAWAGDGGQRDELPRSLATAGLADKVVLLGHRWDVADWLGAADVFVLPSRAEGMPLAVLEAMAKGLPVAASAVSGIPEALGEAGRLLPDPAASPEATAAALADALAGWALDPEARRAAGAACRARAEEHFTEARMLAEAAGAVERALLPRGDYVAPGLEVVRPDRCFPYMRLGDPRGHPWPHLRGWVPHNWYVDGRWPQVGWLSRDEAHLLYHTALRFGGLPALEVGCFCGWSTVHLALAGVDLDVVDPLLARPEFAASVSGALQAAGVRGRARLHAGASPAKVDEVAAARGVRWSLMFVDGDHGGTAPVEDAAACARHAADDAAVVLHDLACPEVAAGLAWLRQRGWRALVYQTMQVMAVAWRGAFEPVRHEPDPAVRWELPGHLRGFDVSGGGA